MLTPHALESSAMSCGCISVGKLKGNKG